MRIQELLASSSDRSKLLERLQSHNGVVDVDRKGLQALLELLQEVAASMDAGDQSISLAAKLVRLVPFSKLSSAELELLLQQPCITMLGDIFSVLVETVQAQGCTEQLEAATADFFAFLDSWMDVKIKGSNGKKLWARNLGAMTFIPLVLDLLNTESSGISKGVTHEAVRLLLEFTGDSKVNPKLFAMKDSSGPTQKLFGPLLHTCGNLALSLDILEIMFWCARANALTAEHAALFKPDFNKALKVLAGKEPIKELRLSEELRVLLLELNKDMGTATRLFSLQAKRIMVGSMSGLAAEGMWVDFGMEAISVSLMLPDDSDSDNITDQSAVDVSEFPYNDMERVAAVNLENKLVRVDITLKKVPESLVYLSASFNKERMISFTFNRGDIEGIATAAPLVAASMKRHGVSVQTSAGEVAQDLTQQSRRKVSWGVNVFSKLPLTRSNPAGTGTTDAKSGAATGAGAVNQQVPKPTIKSVPAPSQQDRAPAGKGTAEGAKVPEASEPLLQGVDMEADLDEPLRLTQAPPKQPPPPPPQQQQEADADADDKPAESRGLPASEGWRSRKTASASLQASDGWRTRKTTSSGKAASGSGKGAALGAFEDADKGEPEVMSPEAKVPKEEEAEERAVGPAAPEQEPAGDKAKGGGRPKKQIVVSAVSADKQKGAGAKKLLGGKKPAAAVGKQRGGARKAQPEEDPIEMTGHTQEAEGTKRPPQAKPASQPTISTWGDDEGPVPLAKGASQGPQLAFGVQHAEEPAAVAQEQLMMDGQPAAAAAEPEAEPEQEKRPAPKAAAGKGRQQKPQQKGSQRGGRGKAAAAMAAELPASEGQPEPSFAAALAGPSEDNSKPLPTRKPPARKAATGPAKPVPLEEDAFNFTLDGAENPTPGMGGTKKVAKPAGQGKKAAAAGNPVPRRSPLRGLTGAQAAARPKRKAAAAAAGEAEEAAKENLAPEEQRDAKRSKKAPAGGAKKPAGKKAAAALEAEQLQQAVKVAIAAGLDSTDDDTEEGEGGAADPTVRGKSLDLSGDLSMLPTDPALEPTMAAEVPAGQWDNSAEYFRAVDDFELAEEEQVVDSDGEGEEGAAGVDKEAEDPWAGMDGGYDSEGAEDHPMNEGAGTVHQEEWRAVVEALQEDVDPLVPDLTCGPESIKQITKQLPFSKVKLSPPKEAKPNKPAAGTSVPTALRALSQGAGARAAGAKKKGAAAKSGVPTLSPLQGLGSGKAAHFTTRLDVGGAAKQTGKFDSALSGGATQTRGTGKAAAAAGGSGGGASAGKKRMPAGAAAALAQEEPKGGSSQGGSKRQKRGTASNVKHSTGGGRSSKKQVEFAEELDEDSQAALSIQALLAKQMGSQDSARGSQDDSDDEGEGMEQLEVLLKTVAKQKRVQAARKVEAMLKEVGEELAKAAAGVERELRRSEEEMEARTTAEFGALNGRLGGIMQRIQAETDGYQARMADLWNDYRQAYGQAEPMAVALSQEAVQLRAANQARVAALEKAAAAKLAVVDKKIAKINRSAKRLPGIAKMLSAFL